MARDKLGRNSPNKSPEVEDALTNLKMAYMLFETWPSGYCIRILKKRMNHVHLDQLFFQAYHSKILENDETTDMIFSFEYFPI